MTTASFAVAGLAPLADNGGPVMTHALLPGSPAISNGNASLLPLDFGDLDGDGNLFEPIPLAANGVERVTLTLDSGAFEVGPTIVDTLTDVVDGDYSAGNLSLREALLITEAGGTILFDGAITGGTTPGVDDGVITLGGTELVILKDVTIDGDTNGDGKADITLDANNQSRVAFANGQNIDVVLRSLDIANGAASSGGALNVFSSTSTLTLLDSTVRDSTVTNSGGGIYARSHFLINSTVSGNSANSGGGIYTFESATLINATVFGNSAGDGGGFYTFGDSTLINAIVSGNTASLDGGALFVGGSGTHLISSSTITDNTASFPSGGVALALTAGTADVQNSIFSGNTSASFASNVQILFGGASITAQSSVLGSDVVTGAGSANNVVSDTPGLGGLADAGGTVMTHTLLPGSVAVSAGDASLLPLDLADLDGDDLIFETLPRDANGDARVIGALDIGATETSRLVVDTLSDVVDGDYSAGNLSLREAVNLVPFGGSILFDSAITGGTTPGVDDGVITLGGLALQIDQSVNIDGDVNVDNRADITINANDTSRVFEVVGASSVFLRSLTIENGDTADNGGAVHLDDTSGFVNIISSTIRDSAADQGQGGGIYAADGVFLALTNSTIEGNSAQSGGGAAFDGSGTSFLVGATFSGNTASVDGGGACPERPSHLERLPQHDHRQHRRWDRALWRQHCGIAQ